MSIVGYVSRRLALALAVLLAAGCGDGALPGQANASKGKRMDAATISACQAQTATMHLVPEALMTRAALTQDTIIQRYPAVAIDRGDPRLARLTAALRGLEIEPAAHPQFDPRLLVQVHCEGGDTITLLGSATEPDGRLHLSVNGRVVSTRTPFRKQMEALAS